MELEDYQQFVWTCENCEHTNVSDLTSGVEADCDECGTICPDVSEDMYEEALELASSFEV